MFNILIAEDDYDVCQLFKHVLLQKGYSVTTVSNGEEALDVMEKEQFDLLISDIMMPVMDGYELVRQMREVNEEIPVLMITAKDAFDDMQKGFLSGTDDYMVKPVNLDEMLLRVAALLRRAKIVHERKQSLGNTIMEFDTFTIISENSKQILPQKEFMLLYKMASYPGKIFTRQQLMDDIWGYDSETDTHTVEVHISRLREKLKDNKDFEIVTMRGVGYKVVKR
ncbi:MAG: response regulator transcription factor [Lachnospiraceae bacterium]|nr:response regulator transcription factor [Lachnospiraceae bacterium]